MAKSFSPGDHPLGLFSSLSYDRFGNIIDPDTPVRRALSTQIQDLKDIARDQEEAIEKHSTSDEEKKALIQKHDEFIEELNRKSSLNYILDSVSEDTHEVLLSDRELLDRFTSGSAVKAFVVSADIRRSTELMLKARSPQDFAAFITDLCSVPCPDL